MDNNILQTERNQQGKISTNQFCLSVETEIIVK